MHVQSRFVEKTYIEVERGQPVDFVTPHMTVNTFNCSAQPLFRRNSNEVIATSTPAPPNVSPIRSDHVVNSFSALHIICPRATPVGDDIPAAHV
jgi:hypothetical protein